MDLDRTAGQPDRLSLDKRPTDSYGRQLLQFCSDRDFVILNRRAPGDTQGYYTYETGSTRSIIDYGIISQSLWSCIRNFQVGVHNSILSDHSITLLELRAHQTWSHTTGPQVSTSPLLRFDWIPEALSRLKISLADPNVQLKLEILNLKIRICTPKSGEKSKKGPTPQKAAKKMV